MAIAQNKRRLDRLERRIEILEDELGVDHSDAVEAEDDDSGTDPSLVTDGGRVLAFQCADCGTVETPDVDDSGQRRCPDCSNIVTVVATDGGKAADPFEYGEKGDGRTEDVPPAVKSDDPSTPEAHIRSAIKQLLIAQEKLNSVMYPEVAEAEIRLRGIADALEEEADE